jgi:hypothetical protein
MRRGQALSPPEGIEIFVILSEILKGHYLRLFKSFSYFQITTVMEFIEDLFRCQNLFWARVITIHSFSYLTIWTFVLLPLSAISSLKSQSYVDNEPIATLARGNRNHFFDR